MHLVAVRHAPCRSATRPLSQRDSPAPHCDEDRAALRPGPRRTATNTAPHCDQRRAAVRRTVLRRATTRESVAASRTPHCGELGVNVREPRIAVRRAVPPAARDEDRGAAGERRAVTNRASRCAEGETFGEPRIARLRTGRFARAKARCTTQPRALPGETRSHQIRGREGGRCNSRSTCRVESPGSLLVTRHSLLVIRHPFPSNE